MNGTPDYLVLVNGENRLPDDFMDHVTILSVENTLGEKKLVEEKTYTAFLRLREDLLNNDGLQLELLGATERFSSRKRHLRTIRTNSAWNTPANTPPGRGIQSITRVLPLMWVFCWMESSTAALGSF